MQSMVRTTSEVADRESRIYINAMVEERIKKEMERQRCVRISRVVHISSLIQRHRKGYLRNIKFLVKSNSGNAAKSYVFINKRRDARLECGEFLHKVESEAEIQSVETESQRDFNYVQSHPTIFYKGKAVPIHQEALDLIPTKNAWDLHMTTSGAISVCRIGNTVNNSVVCNAKKLMKLNILSRISPRIWKRKRDLDCQNKSRPKLATERAVTRSHKKLSMYFMKEYMV